jgi:hypothetical protein
MSSSEGLKKPPVTDAGPHIGPGGAEEEVEETEVEVVEEG